MATLTPSPRMQFFDANGNPLVGGKLYTYLAGTTTPLATYTNSGAGTPNANPVILDSRGEASVWLGTSLYYMELKTSADVLVWTSDNIGGVATLSALAANNGTTLVNGTWFGGVVALLSALATSIGTSLIGFIQAGAGAIARSLQSKLRETVSVKDFGAVGDGVTDDTASIQLAVATGKTVYFPDGNYLVSASISLASISQTFIFDGAIIRSASMVAGGYAFSANGLDNLTFIRPKFVTPSNQPAFIQSGGFIQLTNCNFATVSNGVFVSRGVGGGPTLMSHLSTPGCDDLLIEGNYFAYSYGNACGAQDGVGSGVRGKRVRIVNNIFSENVDTSVGCWTNCSDVVIANNTFKKTSNSPSYNGVMIDIAGATDVVIANNVIVGNTFGIRVVTNGVYTNNNITIIDNIIKNQFVGNTDVGCGIRFAPAGASNSSIKVIGNEITVSNTTCVGIDLAISQTGTATIEIDRNTIIGGAGACLRTQGTGAANPIAWIAGNNHLSGTLATVIHEQQTSPASVVEMGAPVMVNTGVTLTAASPQVMLSGYLQPGLYMVKATFGAVTGAGNCFYRLFDRNGVAVGTNFSAWNSSAANTTPAPIIVYHVLSAGYYYVKWNISSVAGLSYEVLNAELVRVL